MIHGQEQFYERRKKPGRMSRDLPGLCLRGEKPTPGTSVKKGLAGAFGMGKIFDVHTESQDVYAILHAWGYLEGKACLLQRINR